MKGICLKCVVVGIFFISMVISIACNTDTDVEELRKEVETLKQVVVAQNQKLRSLEQGFATLKEPQVSSDVKPSIGDITNRTTADS